MCCWLGCSTHQTADPTDHPGKSTGLPAFHHSPGKKCVLLTPLQHASGHQSNRQHHFFLRVECLSSQVGERESSRKLSVLSTPLQHASSSWFNKQDLQFQRTLPTSPNPRKVGVLLTPLQHASGHRSNRCYHAILRVERRSP